MMANLTETEQILLNTAKKIRQECEGWGLASTKKTVKFANEVLMATTNLGYAKKYPDNQRTESVEYPTEKALWEEPSLWKEGPQGLVPRDKLLPLSKEPLSATLADQMRPRLVPLEQGITQWFNAGIDPSNHADIPSGGSWNIYRWPHPVHRIVFEYTPHQGGLYPFYIEDLAAIWVNCQPIRLPPFSPLIEAWLNRPQDYSRRHLITTSKMKGSGGQADLPLVREPAIATLPRMPLAEVETVFVDGEEFASAFPDQHDRGQFRSRRLHKPSVEQTTLWPGPRTINGNHIDDPVIATLSSLNLDSEHSPLRADLHRLGLLAYALSGPIAIPEEKGVFWLTGCKTDVSKRRWWDALAFGNSLYITTNPKTNQWIKYLNADALKNGIAHLGPPIWWQQGGRGQGGFRLSGGLFRPAHQNTSERGPDVGYWGGLHRTICGLEASLSWGPTTGRGKKGRIPSLLIPVRPGGPGEEVFVPWYMVLIISGDYVPLGASAKGAYGERYRRRRDILEKMGYTVPNQGGSAPAGDTIEITKIVDGRGGKRRAGIYVRATARFCAAYEAGQQLSNWERIPVLRIL